MALQHRPPPAPKGTPFIRLVKVPAGPRIPFLILSQRYYGYDLHYTGHGNKPCTRETGFCAFCTPSNKPRWTGFLGVLSMQTRSQLILPITSGAIQNCPALQSRDGNLRGLVVTASRVGTSEFSGMRIELSPPSPGYRLPDPLPQLNVPAALARWWNVEEEMLCSQVGASDIPCP